MNRTIKYFPLILIPIFLWAFMIFASSQSLVRSSTLGGRFITDTLGSTADSGFIYARFSPCPLELSMVDPVDTFWRIRSYTFEEFFIAESGFGFINTGCIVSNIKLACESAEWRADVTAPPLPGYEIYCLWAAALRRVRPTGHFQSDFYPDGDRMVCLVDTVPNYRKIRPNRFYNSRIDYLPDPLMPPMDTTGLNLYPGRSFYLILMLQVPAGLDPISPDTMATIILHVVAEPASYY